MSHRRFKMFSPERVSILLLIAALCVWASVTMCRRIPKETVIVTADTPASDTIGSDSTIILSEHDSSKKDNSSKKKDSKKEGPKKKVNHRDHLNEPVAPF